MRRVVLRCGRRFPLGDGNQKYWDGGLTAAPALTYSTDLKQFPSAK